MDVPIPIGIDGVVFYDSNPNKDLDTGEYPYANQTIQPRFPNGTIFTTLTTSANGSFSINNQNPGPNQQLFVTTPNGTVLHNFTTNSYGSRHNAEVPIPLGSTRGSTITVGNGTTVCSNEPVDVVVGSLLTSGNSSRTLEVTMMPNAVYQSGSVKAPLGWTLEYSTDGGSTWTTTEPAPASLVTNIRALSPGDIYAGTIVNDTGNTEQEFVSEAAVASSPRAPWSTARPAATVGPRSLFPSSIGSLLSGIISFS